MNSSIIRFFATALTAIGMVAVASASPIQTTGSGSAVTSADRTANFNTVSTGTDLSSYTEGLLSVTTPNSAYTDYDPFNGAGDGSGFHYAVGGVNDWLYISGTDSALMFGVEFLYGNGWASGRPYGLDSANIDWEAYVGATLVGSGSLSLPVGSILGFSDGSGFDLLKIRSTTYSGSTYNAIAIDDLKVQTGPGSQSVPDASNTFALLALALSGLAIVRRKNA